MISAASEHPEEAWALVQALLEPDFLAKMWGREGHFVPARKSAAESVLEPTEPPANRQAILDAMAYGEVFKPYTSSAFEAYSQTQDLFAQAMRGDLSVAKALEQIENVANGILAQDRDGDMTGGDGGVPANRLIPHCGRLRRPLLMHSEALLEEARTGDLLMPPMGAAVEPWRGRLRSGPPSPPGRRQQGPSQAFSPASPVNLTGEWMVTNVVVETSHPPYRDLRLGFRLVVQHDGVAFTGTGEKYLENGRQIPVTARSPIRLQGRMVKPPIWL